MLVDISRTWTQDRYNNCFIGGNLSISWDVVDWGYVGLDASEPRRYAILIGLSKGGFDLKTKYELYEF